MIFKKQATGGTGGAWLDKKLIKTGEKAKLVSETVEQEIE